MTITDFSAKLQSLQTSYKQLFSDLFLSDKKGANDAYLAFTHEDTCDGVAYEYDFLSSDPVMREWVGNKNYVPLRANSLRIAVTNYEKSTDIGREQIRGDKSGIIGQRLAKWLSAVKRDKDAIAFDKLIDGFTDASFDGVALFSASHPNGPAGAVQSNTATTALSIAQFKVINAAMQSLRDENGESLNVSADVLMVGPNLADLAMHITGPNRAYAINGTSALETGVGATAVAVTSIPNTLTVSPYGQSVKVVINPRLVGTYANYWFLIDSTKDGKPVIMASQGEPEARDTLLEYNETPNYKFSVEWSAAVGLGHWATAYGNAV